MRFPFPELGSWFKKRWESRDSGESLSLGLKDYGISAWGQAPAAWYQFNGYQRLAALTLAGVPASSGEIVSRQAALQHPVVYACNQIISQSMGFIPALLYQRNKNGSKRQATEHPLFSCFVNAPNDEITAHAFTELLTSHCLLEGGGFAKILRRSGTGTAIGLHVLLPEQVQVDREKTGQKRLVYKILNESGAVDRTYTVDPGKPHDILHLRGVGWDGLRGYSLIALAREAIGTAIAQERNLALFYQMGGRLPYHIELAKPFGKTEDAKKWRADWVDIVRQPHQPPITEPGMKYESDGLSMIDAQMVELRRSSVEAICRFCNVTPPLVQELSRATFANIEALFQYFQTLTLAPWMSRWEQDVWRCCLTPEEKSQGYFLRHDAKALLRGDFLQRMRGYSTQLQNGIRSINEVRADEDWDAIGPEGDQYHIQLNMQDLDDTLASDQAFGQTSVSEDPVGDETTPKKPRKKPGKGAAEITSGSPEFRFKIDVKPPDVQVDVKPPDVKVDVAPPHVQVDAPVTVHVPKVDTVRTVKRDQDGNITQILEETKDSHATTKANGNGRH